MSKSIKQKKTQGANWPFLAILICLVAGLLVDQQAWIVVTSATLVPVLFLWLIYAYTYKDEGSVRLSYIWGLLGFAMLVFGIYADPKYINPGVGSVIINISGTLISLSVIGVILQLKDTKEYFASTLSDLIMKESYVEKLNRTQLEKLQKTVLERYFENSNDFNRENSFYRFFSTNLQNYIGSPYREHYRNTLSITALEDEAAPLAGGRICLITDDLTYQLRSMGDDLQKDIRWQASKDEIRQLQSFSVHIGSKKLFEWPSEQNQDNTSDLIEHNFAQNPEDGISLVIQLERLSQSDATVRKEYADGAIVKISAKYLATNYKSITAKLLFPTKGFSLSVFHPSDIRCKVESYGFNMETHACEHTNTPQGFTLNYSDWMLPYSGVYVAIEEADLVGQKAPSTVDGEDLDASVVIAVTESEQSSEGFNEEGKLLHG
ncbi:hypothetical protein [Variovorax paradoxus]|uniref:Uncharacterized protein n=1 Tax=Variovorax paradoxus TaxID=34073 RepID=A0A6I6H5R8_VARPD|nr:hypothetical protein [Variovorax paradoxus]QGW82220.1 hypothetical protein GOQ09_11780 [Variovorax paradoxus]